MRIRHGDAADLPRDVRGTDLQFSLQVFPLEVQLSVRFDDCLTHARATDLGGVECISASFRFNGECVQKGCDRSARV